MKDLNDIKLFEKFANRSKFVPIYIRILIIILALVLAVYWIVTDSGPYEYVSDFQARLLHRTYYPVISGLCAIIVALTPAIVIINLLAGFYKKDNVE